jgi:hypothetical protein
LIRAIDYAALFAAAPPYVVLDPDLMIADANPAAVEVVGRPRHDLVGWSFLDAFPENLAAPAASRGGDLLTALKRVLETGKAEALALVRYDIAPFAQPGVFDERWWSPLIIPVLGPDGAVSWIMVRYEDVTQFVRSHGEGEAANGVPCTCEEPLEGELYARAQQVQYVNAQLRKAHARERQVAVTLQKGLLTSPDLARHPNIAVRYLPAVGSLNVCGDWYDVVNVHPDRFAVSVGDVVGHGLEAAVVMGTLRTALNAVNRIAHGPAEGMDILGLYARSVDGALSTTAANVLVDTRSRLIVYSSAGHPPPVLLHPDGSFDLLDQATDPPLGVRPDPVPGPQAALPYTPGDTLILYTDGLIERRGEDIDTGLARLTSTLASLTEPDPEQLADSLLARLGLSIGGRDDTALVIVRL